MLFCSIHIHALLFFVLLLLTKQYNALPTLSRLKFGERAFGIAALRAWNSLPLDLRATVNTGTFKKKLETFLFCKFYPIPY